MPNLLLSGPAGGGKSQAARDAAATMPGPAIVVDYSAIYAALTLAQRGPDGKYPDRPTPDPLVPLTEVVRQRTIRTAVERDIGVVATNSDGRPARREYLRGLLGAGAVERVVDPGRAVVAARLSGPAGLSEACSAAIDRWYRGVE